MCILAPDAAIMAKKIIISHIHQMVNRFFHTLALFAVLCGFWFVFSGLESSLFLLFGAVSSAFAVFIVLRMDIADSEAYPFRLTFSAPFYWLWLLKEMVKSGIGVTKIVWARNLSISPSAQWIPTRQSCDLGRTIYANSITLTPGTVCVDITAKKVLVHALETASIHELEDGEMDRRADALAAPNRPSLKKKAKKA